TGAAFPRCRDRCAGAGRASLRGPPPAPRRRSRAVQRRRRRILRRADAGFRGGARAYVISRQTPERESPLAIALAQCVSSGDRMDSTLRKSTELGVSRIVPIASERSVVRLSSDRADKRVAHWRNVVIAACEQCGRNHVPEVAAIIDFAAFLSRGASDGLRLLLAPDAYRDLKQLEPPSRVTLLVGPEGGLAPEERQRAEGSGFVPVRFGPRVLRTETAPLATIAAMQALWG